MRPPLCAFHSKTRTWAAHGHTTPDHPKAHPAPLPISSPLFSSIPRSLQLPRYQYGVFWFLLLAVLCLWLIGPSPAHAAHFRVGVVGPWSCDPLFSKALPSVAAQLAVNRINRDPVLSLAATFDYVILEEKCETSRALDGFMESCQATGFIGPANPGYCDAASLLGKGWNKAVFSWGCVGYELDDVRSHPTFAHSMPRPTWVLISLMQHFRWAQVGIIASSEDSWVETSIKVANSLRSHGMPVRLVVTIGNDPGSVRKTLAKLKKVEDLRLVIMCMHSALIGGGPQKLLLETAKDMRLTEGSLVFLPYDTLLYSLPYHNVTYPALRSNSKLLKAYDAVLTVTIDSPKTSFYQAYQEAIDRGEIAGNVKPTQVSPLFGTIYSSVLFMAHAVHRVKASGEASAMLTHTHTLLTLSKQCCDLFQGFSHPVRTNMSGASLADYVILDTDGKTWDLRPTHRIEMAADMVRFLGRDIHFPHGISPKTDSNCWFIKGIICTGGTHTHTQIYVNHPSFLFVYVSLLLSRRRINHIRLFRGPNKILLTLDDVTFINPSLSNKVSSYRLMQELNIQIDNFTSSTFKKLFLLLFCLSLFYLQNGDWAWLKRLPHGTFRNINPKTSDVFELMKDMRHENINLFLGFFHDCGVFAIVTEFCTRGSMEDLLLNEDVKLDWMFKSSLLLDLIKGMKYLHHRNLYHGRLKSRNCVVDGRFVLKISDYGYNEVLEAAKFPYTEPPAEDLLWTAPEILRGPSPGLYGSLHGDVYSFAIIMQEVVMRGPPFYMLEQSAKIRKPPPLCRPVVSPDYAPMECIQLMKQCWNEEPDRRPCFDQIFDLFKNINKGRKTNIIDSMLRMLEQYSSNLEELIRERTEELEIEKQKTEKLLTQMLPPTVANALKVGGTVEPEYFDNVTLYFSDIVGFTTISANSEPIEVVDLLNDLYTLFDAIIGNHDVYKVETIGDAYMVASGLPVANGDRHAAEISNMALDILSAVGTFKMRHMPDVPVRIRIGLHSGPCVAGVVGLTMPRYCLFGDTVTTASRMESTGMPYRIHVHNSTVKILLELKAGYKVQLRGKTDLKGKGGTEETYWLIGKDNFEKPLPVPPEFKKGQMAHGLQMEEIARYKKKKAEKLQQLTKKNN
uniref:Guanylate cyclase n=1 Tax=Oncorhynchus kisutch TaxID=8019 RepID=A0A8C7IGQ2_ONCKI